MKVESTEFGGGCDIQRENYSNSLSLSRDNFPKFHKGIFSCSLKNQTKIKKSYSDVLGLQYLDHLSINIVSPIDEIIFISSTPETGINVCASGLWVFDYSIHPDVFKNRSFYWWSECYDNKKFSVLKQRKELANGLNDGFIFSKKVNNHYVLYSFASRSKKENFIDFVKSNHKYFFDAGDHCLDKIKNICEPYCIDLWGS
jgi:hypothetical protein